MLPIFRSWIPYYLIIFNICLCRASWFHSIWVYFLCQVTTLSYGRLNGRLQWLFTFLSRPHAATPPYTPSCVNRCTSQKSLIFHRKTDGKDCHQFHIGHTVKLLLQKHREHKANILHRRENSALFKHVSEMNHTIDSNNSSALCKVTDNCKRLIVESAVISETSINNFNLAGPTYQIDKYSISKIMQYFKGSEHSHLLVVGLVILVSARSRELLQVLDTRYALSYRGFPLHADSGWGLTCTLTPKAGTLVEQEGDRKAPAQWQPERLTVSGCRQTLCRKTLCPGNRWCS